MRPCKNWVTQHHPASAMRAHKSGDPQEEKSTRGKKKGTSRANARAPTGGQQNWVRGGKTIQLHSKGLIRRIKIENSRKFKCRGSGRNLLGKGGSNVRPLFSSVVPDRSRSGRGLSLHTFMGAAISSKVGKPEFGQKHRRGDAVMPEKRHKRALVGPVRSKGSLFCAEGEK